MVFLISKVRILILRATDRRRSNLLWLAVKFMPVNSSLSTFFPYYYDLHAENFILAIYLKTDNDGKRQ